MTLVLLVEDDAHLGKALGIALQARGYRVATATSAADARAARRRAEPDLVLLDLGLPDVDGIDLLREWRSQPSVPTLVLSARADRYDKIRALDNGADDYVTKPFDFEELLARMRAALRRARPSERTATVRTEHFSVDLGRKEVLRHDGVAIALTPTEWAFLEALVNQPGTAIGSADILRQAWGPGFEKRTNYLRVYAAQLRKKLEPDPAQPRYIVTIPGVGYRFDGAQDAGGTSPHRATSA